MGRRIKVLVASSKTDACNRLLDLLESNGYECRATYTKEETIDCGAVFMPDIVLVDLDNPEVKGMEVLGRLRDWSHALILALSERNQDEFVISALDGGAHEFVAKPIAAEVVLARVRALERCREAMLLQKSPVVPCFTNGELCIDYATQTVSVAGKEIHLTPHEYQLLRLLSLNAGGDLSHQRILREVWGSSQEGDLASLRVLVGSLRKKVETDSSNPRYIQTRAGVGYRMAKV